MSLLRWTSRFFGKKNRTIIGKRTSFKALVETLEDRCVPANFYVATTGDDTTGLGTIASPYRSMQKALEVADLNVSAPHTINVASGTYNTPTVDVGLVIGNSSHPTPNLDNLTIDAGWDATFSTQTYGSTVYFPQANINNSTPSGLTPDAVVYANGVTVRGFTFIFDGLLGAGGTRKSGGLQSEAPYTIITNNTIEAGYSDSNPRSAGIVVHSVAGGVSTGVQVTNNTIIANAGAAFGFSNGTTGIFVNPDTAGLRVTPILISGNTISGPNLGTGIAIDRLSYVTVDGNTIERTGGVPVASALIDLRQATAGTGPYGTSQAGIIITNNTLDGLNGAGGSQGILLSARASATQNVTGVTISGNFIRDVSVGIWGSHPNVQGSGVTVSGNSFTGIGSFLASFAGTGTMNASGNYLGTTNQTTVAAALSGSVDVSPYLASGVDMSVATGFQGDLSTLYVTAQGAQTGPTGRIREGIDLVTTGGTVNVTAGAYTEFVTISKSLNLLGAQTGVDARSGRGPVANESVIDGSGTSGIIWVNGLGLTVKVDGFTLQSDASISVFNNGFGAAITTVQSSNLTGLNISNNIVQNASIGIVPQGNLATIQYNLIRDITIPGPAAGSGIYTDFGLTNSLIDSNAFANNPNTSININSSGASNIVSNNTGANGIYLHAQSGSQVIGNTLTNAGITLGGNQNNLLIQNNEVNGVAGGFAAFRLRDDAGGPNSGVTVSNNKFIGGPGAYGVRPGPASYTGTLTLIDNQISGGLAAIRNDDAALAIDASRNYWGTSVAATVALSLTGVGAAVIDFTPLFDNNETVPNQAVVGFQPDFSSLTVHTLGAQTGMTGRITEGYNDLAATGTINVLGGTYTDTINLDAGGKAVALSAGASPGQVHVTGSFALSANDSLPIEINGTSDATQYDNWVVTGAVDLGAAALTVSTGWAGLAGTTYTIVQKVPAGAVTGTFASKPEGTVFVGGTRTYQITYQGGDGNDVVLTDFDPAAPIISGTPGGDEFRVVRNGVDLEVWLNGNLIWSTLYTSITGGLTVNGVAGNDTLLVDLTSGLLQVPVTFNGGPGTDSLGMKGNGAAIVSRPNGSAQITDPKSGTIDIGPLTNAVTYSGIEPLDINGGGGPVSIVLTGDDDLLDISTGVNLTTALVSLGSQAALVISGTTGVGFFESHAVWNASSLSIDTTTVAGTDAITVTSASNAPAVAALSINTGTEALDTITVNGVITVSGTTTLNAKTINLNANVTNAVTGATATVVNVNPSGQIQDGVNVAASGATINVADGLYKVSNTTVDRSVKIIGQSRAGVVIAPAAEDSNIDSSFAGSYQHGFIVQANNVTIQDLTIDGQGNSSLTVGKDNFRTGIITQLSTPVANLKVDNVHVNHIFRRGIQISYTGTGNVISNSTVENVTGAGGSSYGVIVFDGDASITGNTITNATTGIGSNRNDYSANGSYPLLTIQSNTISSTAIGLYISAAADGSIIGGATAPLGNTINTVGAANDDIGMIVTYTAGAMTIQHNQITGSGGDAAIRLGSNEDPNNPVKILDNTLSTTASTSASAGQGAGIFLTDDRDIFNGGFGVDAKIYTTILRNAITGFQIGIDLDQRATANGGPQPIVAAIGSSNLTDANTITGSGTAGIRVKGALADATISKNNLYDNSRGIRFTGAGKGSVTGNDFRDTTAFLSNATDLRLDSDAGTVTIGAGNAFAGGSDDAVSFANPTGYYIDNRSGQTLNLVGMSTTFYRSNGTSNAALTAGVLADDFRIEDRLYHAPDQTGAGLIRVNANQVYVTTPGTGANDETIQNAVNGATAGDTIHVAAGTFAENVVVNKSLTLRGAQFGVDARGRVASESIVQSPNGGIAFDMVANSITVDGFRVLDGLLRANGNNLTIVNNLFTVDGGALDAGLVGSQSSAIGLGNVGGVLTVSQNSISATGSVGGDPFVLGPLDGQNGWSGGAQPNFTNNDTGIDNLDGTFGDEAITNAQSFSPGQSWRYSRGYVSPSQGTPFTPNLGATVGAPSFADVDTSTVTFAFRAVGPAGDGSSQSIYEGNVAGTDRTGAQINIQNLVTGIRLFTNVYDPNTNLFSIVELGLYAIASWHTVEMVTVYNDNPALDLTTFKVDNVTVGTANPWTHIWRQDSGFGYTPGSRLKFSGGPDGNTAVKGFYYDDVSMVISNSPNPGVPIASYSTNFTNSPTSDLNGVRLSGDASALTAFNFTNNDVDGGVAGLTGSSGIRLAATALSGVVTISGNDVTGFESGVSVAAGNSAIITGNVGSIHGNVIGIDVNGGSATITGNHIYDNTTGIRVTNAGTATIGTNDFEGALDPDNLTDIRLDSTAGTTTINDGNAFAGNTYFIDNRSTQAINLAAFTMTSFEGLNKAVLTGAYAIEDKLYHAPDQTGTGLIRVNVNQVYVTTPGTGANDETIQNAVNGATAGDTINVAAGTFVETVAVNKTLTIKGAQVGVDARTRGVVPESIVAGADGGFQILADNVSIDGFTIQGAVNNPSVFPFTALGVAIWSNPSFNATLGGHQIRNNIIQNNIGGIFLNNEGTYQTVVQYNLFRNNTLPGPASGFGVYSDVGLNNALIDNNTFTNTALVVNSWALGVGDGVVPNDNVTFSNNDVTNFGRGVYFYNVDNSTISTNSMVGTSNYAIGLFDGNATVSVSSNRLVNNNRGIWLGADFGNQNTSITIAQNGFFNSTIANIEIDNGSYTGILNASANYFGTSVPATAQITFDNNDIDTTIDFTPLIDNNESVPNQSVVGFQADLSSLTVHTLGSQFGATPRIQEGYNVLAGSSLTLNVLSGIYSGTTDLGAFPEKAVTLSAGASPGRVVHNGNFTLSSNDSFPIEIDGPSAVGPIQYDNWVVNGTVTLGDAALPALTGVHMPAVDNIFTIIANDDVDAVTGTFAGLDAGDIVSPDPFNGATLKIFYTGNDGNDVILANQIVTTIYVSANTWGYPNVVGTFIPDADLGTAGPQPAIIGYNAFSTINAGLPFLTANGSIVVNAGAYGEAVNLTGARTLYVTGPDATAAVSIGDLSSVANTIISITRSGSTLTVGSLNGTATIAGTITGAGTFIKTGSGTTTLSGANNYTGGTTLSQGTLVHANESATGLVTASITIGDGNTGANNTTLRFTDGVINLNNATTYKPITVEAVAGVTTFDFAQGIEFVNAALTINKAITIDTTGGGSQYGLLGPISGAGAGAGTSVTFANTGGAIFYYTAGYSGAGVTVNSFAGNVAVTGDITIQNVDYLAPGNPAYANGAIPDTASVAISGGATWTQGWGAEAIDDLSGAGTLNNGGYAITVGADDGSGNFSGILTGSGSLTKIGTGTQTLSGAASNTYTGATNINAGTLALSKTPTATAIPGPGNITIGNGAATAVLQINRAEQIANLVNIALNGTGAQLFSNLPVNEVETLAPLNQFVPAFSTGINDFTGGDVMIGGLGTLIIDGDYVQGRVGDTPGTTTLAGGLLQAGAGGINNYNLVTGSLQGYGTVTLDQLNNEASISPNNGANVGTITIRGNLDLQATSIINLDVTADGGGQHDTIAVTLNPNKYGGVLTPPTVADPFTNGTVYFRGTLNVDSIGAAPANLANFDGVMTFAYRLLSATPFTPVSIVAPAGATIRQPTDFNVKNLNQAFGPVYYDPRFLSATGQLNAISQTTNNHATPASARLFAATDSVGAATKLSLTALTSLSGPHINSDVTVTRGLISANGSTRHQNLMITVTNTSVLPIDGPIYIEFTISEASVQLFNKAGLTTALKPYVVVSAGGLAVGASASIQLEWSNPNQIPFNYTTNVYNDGLVATDAYSPGSSPGGDERSFFPINGGGEYNFELTNATGTAASMNGWDMATVMPSVISPTSAEILFSATPTNPYTLYVNTLVNDGVGQTHGLADNFDPTQNYAWKFLDGSHPATFVSGAFNPAAFNIVTAGFQNAFAGSFSVELRDSGKNLYLVYKAPALAPTVTSINRIIGPTTGGTLVTILGANFTDASAVTFDGFAASNFTVLSATEIVATTAAHIAGAVNILVTTPGGTASLQGANDFTFAKPAITSVAINAGGSITLGGTGTVVDLAGQNSIVKQILVTFNQAVSVANDAFTVTPRTSNVTVHGGSPIATAAATTSVTMISPSEYLITFVDDGGQSARNGGILNSGIYDLTTHASKVSANGDTMAANRIDPIVSLFGSIASNSTTTTGTIGDGQSRIFVDPGSLFQFSDAFGSRSDIGTSYNIAFDANLDGFIDPGDLFAFSDSFGNDWSF